jgi:hypothetical protein
VAPRRADARIPTHTPMQAVTNPSEVAICSGTPNSRIVTRPEGSGRAGPRQSLCPGEPSMGTLCAGKGCRLDSQARRSGRPDLDLDATLRAGAGYRRVGGLDDSSPGLWSGASPTTSGWSRTLTRAPACAFRSPAMGEAHASGRGGNCGGFRHTPRAGFHQFLCGVRAESASGQPGTEASHRAGEPASWPEKRPAFRGG